MTSLPKISKRVQIHSATEIYEPLTPWVHSLEALNAVSAVLTLDKVSGTGRCRLGVQSSNKVDGGFQSAAVLSDTAYLSTDGSEKFYRFDPNGVGDGNIKLYQYFRLVLLVSLSGAAPGTVDVTLDAAWR